MTAWISRYCDAEEICLRLCWNSFPVRLFCLAQLIPSRPNWPPLKSVASRNRSPLSAIKGKSQINPNNNTIHRSFDLVHNRKCNRDSWNVTAFIHIWLVWFELNEEMASYRQEKAATRVLVKVTATVTRLLRRPAIRYSIKPHNNQHQSVSLKNP